MYINIKNKSKDKAIKLRKKGFSYNEILKIIPVAKSTLSLWLRSVGLSKKQKQRLTEKKLKAMRRGWKKVKQIRLNRTKNIYRKTKEDISQIEIDNESLFLMGLMLYWAEGSKQKENKASVSQGVIFSNSDPYMISFFLIWVKKIIKIPNQRIVFEIYIHESKKNEIKKIKEFWSKVTGFSIKKFDRIYYKKHNIKTNRKKIGEDYFGLLRIRIRQSTDLNREIAGWINALCYKCGVV